MGWLKRRCRPEIMEQPDLNPAHHAQALRGSPVYFGPGPYVLIIRPAALPSGAGLTLFYPTPAQIRTFHHYHRHPGSPLTPSVGLVQASPQCTGPAPKAARGAGGDGPAPR